MEGSDGSSYYNPPAQGTRVELPDLNITVEEGFHTQIPDLNIGVEANTIELSSATPLICDLNIEPATEDDTSIEGETTMLPSNNGTQMPHEHGSNVEESNSNMEEADFDMEDADFDAEEAYFDMEAYLDFVEAGFDMEMAYLDMEEADFDMEEAEVQGSSHKRPHNMLSNEERMTLYRVCLENSIYGKLKDGTKRMLAASFGVCTKTIQRLWKRAKETGNVFHMKTKNCGRKRIQLDSDQFRQIPLSRRSTLRSMADALKISKSTLHRLLKIGAILRHSSSLRPNLTPENKVVRLRFCLKMLESDDSTFKGMYDTIHIDEKWFYLTRKSVNYYLLLDEEEPHRMCKSKNFIPKVMFLTAVARPRFDAAGNVLFSGKIGVFPLVTTEPAKRSSVNRPASTIETKPITTVNKDVMKKFLIDKVLPAIREKWSLDDMSFNRLESLANGIAEFVGSVEVGKLAGLVLWKPSFFGAKPEMVIKGEFLQSGNDDSDVRVPLIEFTLDRSSSTENAAALRLENGVSAGSSKNTVRFRRLYTTSK
ncbi:hypothetical protein CCACVL1_18273 [Corchorus capsularis]|uniref:Urease domain-containing protein n=1 Tax=Corchorus capsularis TaxID=210143 RepID=A0A1R3HLY9_COCAP|nr:hypothetical protein CCACVL1_18273 [Corchorus capsularis]